VTPPHETRGFRGHRLTPRKGSSTIAR
jgi:hypothetical protein